MRKLMFTALLVCISAPLFAQESLNNAVERAAFKAETTQQQKFATAQCSTRPTVVFNQTTYLLKTAQSGFNWYVPQGETDSNTAQETSFQVFSSVGWPKLEGREMENGEDAERELDHIAEINEGLNLYDLQDERADYIDLNGHRNALFAYKFSPKDGEQPYQYKVTRFVLLGENDYVSYTFTYATENGLQAFNETVNRHRGEWILAMYEMDLPKAISGSYQFCL